jgi:hypothetical protein
MRNSHISIPGFKLSGDNVLVVPCVCPNSKVWLNWLGRYAFTAELLLVQGLWLRPILQSFPDKTKMQACGNAFSSTLVANLQCICLTVGSALHVCFLDIQGYTLTLFVFSFEFLSSVQ